MPELEQRGRSTLVTDDEYEAMRIEAGVPRQGLDIDETTIAQEAFLERDAVSFTKGCFLGQELVCRIDTRGHVNRLLRRLVADAPLARGATVVADGKEVGTVTSAVGGVALATDPPPGRTREHRPRRRRQRPSRSHLRRDRRLMFSACEVENRLITHNERLVGGVAGRVTVMRAPPDAGASATARPPIAAASSCTMARPSPVPTARPGVAREV